MKHSNKKPCNNIWKVLLIIWDIIVLVFLVWFNFMYSLEILSEDPSVEPIIQEEIVDRIRFKVETPEPTIFYEQEKSQNDFHELTFEEIVASYVFDICKSYPNVDPYIVLSVIYQESRFTPNVSSGNCVGLMQVSTYWHRDRAARLNVNDFLDPYSNILIGVDLLSELSEIANGDVYYTLMLYNQTMDSAKQMHLQGIISDYAKEVVNRADEYRGGIFDEAAQQTTS